MAELKTQANDASVPDFLNAVSDERRRADAHRLDALMRQATGEPPRMWGESIVGYGHYRYRYASGREGEWMLTGFSPRKSNLTVYLMAGFDGYEELLGRLGKFTTGKSCLYLKRLSDVDEGVLRELVRRSADHMRQTNPA